MNIYKINVGKNTGIPTNCYIISELDKCIIIDPGDEADKIIREISRLKLEPQLILCTHTHIDHIKDVIEIQNKYKIVALIHPEEEIVLKNYNLAELFQIEFKMFNYEFVGNEIKLCNKRFDIILTPGHTRGSITIINRENYLMFTGDLIFKEGVGRFDLPTGNEDELKKSISKIIEFKEDYKIYPGHGPLTTLKNEREFLEKLVKI